MGYIGGEATARATHRHRVRQAQIVEQVQALRQRRDALKRSLHTEGKTSLRNRLAAAECQLQQAEAQLAHDDMSGARGAQ